MPSTSESGNEWLAIDANDVWVKFLIQYHRAEVTLRGSFVNLLDRFRRNGAGSGRGKQEFWALRGITLQARPGEVIGLLGRNGAGKTTFLKTLAGICEPDRGSVVVRGTVGCLLSFGVGFNPNLSGRENIFLNGSLLGLPREAIAERIERIVEFSELGDFIDAPVRTYSAGMRGRLGFSIAVHIDPDILLLDEVLSVGDAGFRTKAGTILDRFRSERKTVVLATHNMNLVRNTCTRALWLEQGQIKLAGAPDEIVDAYAGEVSPGEKQKAAAGRSG